MLGFRGHFVTKSRGYSTTLGQLRAAPRRLPRPQDEPPGNTEVNDDGSAVVLSVWQYLGSGYLNPGDMLLAAGVQHPCRPPENRCTICIVGHRNDGLDKRTPSRHLGRMCPFRNSSRAAIRNHGPWVLAGHAGVSEREWHHRVCVAYATVAEFQARERCGRVPRCPNVWGMRSDGTKSAHAMSGALAYCTFRVDRIVKYSS
jgi:Replication initiator protein, pSAM2